MIIETLITVLSFVYLFMIVEIIFSSTKDVMTKQKAFEGRILFFIYSLIVYYKDLKLDIFLWDTFLNEPIKQAYTLMNTLLESFFGISIAGNPIIIFAYLIPAGFVYNFVKYWFSYGFGDEKIANMISLTAVVMFIAKAGNLGLINSIVIDGVPVSGVPFGGFLSSSTIFYLLDVFPSKFIGLDTFLNFGFTSDISLSILMFVLILGAIAGFFMISRILLGSVFLSGDDTKKEKGERRIKKTVSSVSGLVFVAAILLYFADKFFSFDLASIPILHGLALPVFFIAGLTLIAVVADFLVFVAFWMIIKDINAATGNRLDIKK